MDIQDIKPLVEWVKKYPLQNIIIVFIVIFLFLWREYFSALIKKLVNQGSKYIVIVLIIITVSSLIMYFIIVDIPTSPPLPQPSPQPENSIKQTKIELNSAFSNSMEEIKKMPWIIPTLKDSLHTIVEKTFKNEKIQNGSPILVANIYRIYSASLFLGSEGEIGQIREGVLWLRRAMVLYSNWSDSEEVFNSMRFFQETLDGKSSIEVRKMLYHGLRIGMIELPSQQVEKATDQGYEIILKLFKNKNITHN